METDNKKLLDLVFDQIHSLVPEGVAGLKVIQKGSEFLNQTNFNHLPPSKFSNIPLKLSDFKLQFEKQLEQENEAEQKHEEEIGKITKLFDNCIKSLTDSLLKTQHKIITTFFPPLKTGLTALPLILS